MITISLCMIVRDEEETLGRCLDSIADIVDEIIIVDTGSVDRTKEIAQKYTEHIYDFEWVDDFSVARNYSFSKATKEYCMWMDADDVLLEKDQTQLKKLKEELDPSINSILLKYDLGLQEDGTVFCTFYRERILKRSENPIWVNPVHEYVDYAKPVFVSDMAITHRKMKSPTSRNLNILDKHIEKGNELNSRNCFYYGRELHRAGQYEKAIIYFQKFLETNNDLMSSYLDACLDLSDSYSRLNNPEKALSTLFRFFEYDAPRPEILCRIGYYFKEKENYEKAIIWFNQALHLPKPQQSMGSIHHFYWDYIPYMELCACHYKNGDIDSAIYYNEQAASVKPTDSKILNNRMFLADMKKRLVEYRKQKQIAL